MRKAEILAIQVSAALPLGPSRLFAKFFHDDLVKLGLTGVYHSIADNRVSSEAVPTPGAGDDVIILGRIALINDDSLSAFFTLEGKPTV